MKTTAAVQAYLNLLFKNVDWANIGDAAGLQNSATVGSFYVSLHTADPGRTGSQNTTEAGYGGYARVEVPRGSSDWTQTASTIVNSNTLLFPACTSGSETELYWGIGTDSSGAGNLLYTGPITTAFMGFTAATTGDITIPGHSLIVNDRVAFFKVSPDWAFPTGMTESTVYYVVSVAGDVVTVSTTLGGSAITISAAGSGDAAEVTPFAVSTGVIPAISASSMVIIDY